MQTNQVLSHKISHSRILSGCMKSAWGLHNQQSRLLFTVSELTQLVTNGQSAVESVTARRASRSDILHNFLTKSGDSLATNSYWCIFITHDGWRSRKESYGWRYMCHNIFKTVFFKETQPDRTWTWTWSAQIKVYNKSTEVFLRKERGWILFSIIRQFGEDPWWWLQAFYLCF